MATFPDPDDGRTDPAELFAVYLDFFRATVAEKLAGLGEAALHDSRLPSGWSPLELVNHLAHMERRWLQWGFLGLDVPEPWGDVDADGRWQVPAGATAADLVAGLHAVGAETARIVEAHVLDARGTPGGRFVDREPPTLGRILFHVLQEYARHVGHLDIARELADGAVGE